MWKDIKIVQSGIRVNNDFNIFDVFESLQKLAIQTGNLFHPTLGSFRVLVTVSIILKCQDPSILLSLHFYHF
jgi:hypothetical protein